MLSSLCYRFALFVKGLTKTDHDNTGIYIQIRKPYFMKHVGKFVNVIRILQRMYGFFELPRN